MGNKLATEGDERKKKKNKYVNVPATPKAEHAQGKLNKKVTATGKVKAEPKNANNDSSGASTPIGSTLSLADRGTHDRRRLRPNTLAIVAPNSSASTPPPPLASAGDKETLSTLTDYHDAASHLNSPDLEVLNSPDLLEEIALDLSTEISNFVAAVSVASRFLSLPLAYILYDLLN